MCHLQVGPTPLKNKWKTLSLTHPSLSLTSGPNRHNKNRKTFSLTAPSLSGSTPALAWSWRGLAAPVAIASEDRARLHVRATRKAIGGLAGQGWRSRRTAVYGGAMDGDGSDTTLPPVAIVGADAPVPLQRAFSGLRDLQFHSAHSPSLLVPCNECSKYA